MRVRGKLTIMVAIAMFALCWAIGAMLVAARYAVSRLFAAWDIVATGPTPGR